MEASVIVGQSTFSANSANQGGSANANTLNNAWGVTTDGTRLFVADATNHRVLVWNTIPTANNTPADVVIGQPDMTTVSAGLSAVKLDKPNAIFYDSATGKLFISDYGNNRVLIYNQVPTSNGATADVVVGQPDFTTESGPIAGTVSTKLFFPYDVMVTNGKLVVADAGNDRIAIWNTIPTTNGATIDVVIGKPSVTTYSFIGGSCTSVSSTTMNLPEGVAYDGSRLYISDSQNARVLIYNSIPTSSGAAANYVIGQPNFDGCQTGITNAAQVRGPSRIRISNNRLFIADTSANRILIYNTLPTSNEPSADVVIGQANFTTATANQGAAQPHAGGFSAPYGLALDPSGNRMFIAEYSNNRVLIFDNLINKPGISINNAPEGRDGGLIRLRGTARVDSPYTVQSVQYAVNGGGFANATATDGSFNSISEDFYFDFDLKSNNYNEDGYTVRIKSTNNNTDVTDQLFYFSPFTSNSPSNNSYTTNQLPTFEFTVNKGRFQDLKDNLSKFQVQINKDNSGWQTYIDNVPVSYEAVKGDGENIYRTGDNTTNGNGTYEDKKMWVNYSNNNATIKVYAKGIDNTGNVTDAFFENGGKKLRSGSYQWKIVAVDKAGHTQETDSKYIRINTTQAISSQGFFPLAVLNISGLGNPNMSTTNISAMKSSYNVSSVAPTFYGIANVNSKVTLELTDKGCSEKGESDCVKTYDTTTNPESRFGINVPVQTLHSGKIYSTRMFVSYENDYNELPSFDLNVR